jgi:Ni,Fe-hydrogenase I cytochrome b subunit
MIPMSAMHRLGAWLAGLFLIAQIFGLVRVSTFGQKGQFQASEKSQLALIINDFAPAF